MFQVIAHVIGGLIFVRGYLKYVGEWSGGECFCILWHFEVGLFMSVLATNFWDLSLLEANSKLLIMIIFSTFLLVVNCIFAWVMNVIMGGPRSMYWLAANLAYTRSVIFLLYQRYLRRFTTERGVLYTGWYLYQFDRRTIEFMWFVITVIACGIVFYCYFYVCCNGLFTGHYFSYWLWLFWQFDGLIIEELFIFVIIYICGKYFFVFLGFYFGTIVPQVHEVGVLMKKLFFKKNFFVTKKVDYKTDFCYTKLYSRIWLNSQIYEVPGMWWNWKQEVIDRNYNYWFASISLWWRILMYWVYFKTGLRKGEISNYKSFSFNYRYWCLEQDEMYDM